MSSDAQIEYELKNRFYYIEYPDGENNYIWTGREGEIHPLNTMSLDHLKASINLVKKNINSFKSMYDNTKFANGEEILNALLPLVISKLKELETEFKVQTSL